MNDSESIELLFYEGYLRNRKRLCGELSVEPGKTRRETEEKLLRKAYGRWGRDLGNHLYGSFSLALWDGARRELICIRDPLGITPLYYAQLPDGELLCAADIRAIADDPRYKKELDEEALQLYMMFGYPIGERTLFRGIRKLMPGQVLVWKDGIYRIDTYDSPTLCPEQGRSKAEWTGRIDETLQAILREDRENFDFTDGCVLLSAGVDSAYLLASAGMKNACGIGYGESEASETPLAAETAKLLGADFEKLRITSDEFLDALPRVVQNAGLPLADASAAAFAIGCGRAAGRHSVFLSGEGADELFAGYHVYERAAELGRPEACYCGCDGVMDQQAARELLGQEFQISLESLLQGVHGRASAPDDLSRMLLVDQTLWLEGDILFGVSQAARAADMELLMPYADLRMCELAARIPAALKRKDGCGKHIFRRTVLKKLPMEIAFRQKVGFYVPIAAWLGQARHRARLEAVLFGPVSKRFFDGTLLRRRWEAFHGGDTAQWRVLYAVYVFVLWYEGCFLT